MLQRHFTGLLAQSFKALLVFTLSDLQGGDDDIEAVLAKFRLEDDALSRAEILTDVDPPSARVHSSFTATTSQVEYIAMHNGLCLDYQWFCLLPSPNKTSMQPAILE
jgi:hypothetical protein